MDKHQAKGKKAWMENDEESVFAAFVEEIHAYLDERGVTRTPFLRLRVEWLATLVVLMKRCEDGLAEAALQKPATTESAKTFSILLDTLIKIWERIQKVMNEIEDHCAKAGTPIDTGLADKMKPLLQRTEGIVESLLSKGAARPRRRAPKKPIDKSGVIDKILDT